MSPIGHMASGIRRLQGSLISHLIQSQVQTLSTVNESRTYGLQCARQARASATCAPVVESPPM